MSDSSISFLKTQNAINVSFQMAVSVRKEGNLYHAKCKALDVYSQGYTVQEAEKNIIEAIQLFIESCLHRGVLEEELKSIGARPHRDHVTLALNETGDSGERAVNVPISLLISEHVEQAEAH